MKEKLNINNIRVLHNNVLVKLLPKKEIITSSGLITPDFEHYETDGGRLGMRPIFEQWENYGLVINSDNPKVTKDCTVYFKNNVKLEIIDEEEGYAIVNELQISYIVIPQPPTQVQ